MPMPPCSAQAGFLHTPPAGVPHLPSGVGANAATRNALLCLPQLVAFLVEASAARKELLKVVARRRYGEMLWEDCVKVNLKVGSRPPMLWCGA
jgi:hypothetical protein